MNGFLRLLVATIFVAAFANCASAPSDEDGSELDSTESADAEVAGSESTDEAFEDLDDPSSNEATEANASNEDQSLEDELNSADGAPDESQQVAEDQAAPQETEPAPVEQAANEQQPTDEFADFEEEQPAPIQEEPPPPVIADEQPLETIEAPPPIEAPAVVEEAPPEEAPLALVNIKNIRFKANDNGGTVMVDGDGPLTFNTRTNPETNQFIIEIPSSNLPRKLKRPFNTRDMAGIVGSIDAYQNSGSTTSRIVIQLRPGAPEPVVQSEGNSLLVVAGGAPSEEPDTQATPQETADVAPVSQEAESTSILSAQSLEEFLSGNMQFYGKPISIETSGMEIREVFKFLSEESGINMVLGDEVKGQISLKLRQVPWDQAFVLVMRAKKLGYTRTGNVIRVAAVADIRAEEDEVVRLANAKKNQTPLSVRVIPISYAKVEEMTRQIQPFLSERGKIAADSRTSSLVISDLDENIERAQKLIQAIDVPPPQVLIEGKVVEASDTFQRSIGVRWGASGQTFGSGRTRGNLNFDINPGITKQTLGINFSLGTLDILGNLTSSLALFEDQNEIKVLSSPRIVALHNENATINQTTEIPIVTTAAQSGGAAATTTVSFKPVKLAMTVTPQVTNDGAVIMTVDVNRDSLGARAEGGTNAQAVNTRGAKTKVLVRNGQTAVIGGIYQNDANVSEAKVPWLGDIPVVGWLFKSRSTNTAKNELLIFLTPRIISNADSMGSDSGGTDL